jgi:hemolysin activation/secretion protein
MPAAYVVAAALLPACGDAAGVRPIDRVEVVRRGVFDERPEGLAWPYRVANRLHARTREDVVRRELLAGPGDCADAEALAQSERNLRAAGFLRDARVETAPAAAGGDRVDVRVTTADTWTTSPHLRLAQVGNRRVWTVGLAERNLLGRGQQLEVQRRSDIDRDQTLVAFRDPRLAGSRVALVALAAGQSDGHRAELSASVPFHALDAAWSFRARVEDLAQRDPLYADGERVSELRHLARAIDLEAGRLVRRTGTGALRVHAAYRLRRDAVGDDRRRFGIAEAGVHFLEHRYLRLTHVNRFERAEDFNLGRQLSATAGVSAAPLGGEPGTAFFAGGRQRTGLSLGRERFLLADVDAGARRHHGRWENALARMELKGLARLSPRALLLARGVYRHGANLDPETQLTLGASNGLRGYAVHQFAGTRALLLAAEARLFVADDVKQLLSFAVAAFVETGYAWPQGTRVALHDLRGDAGLGLMIGRNRLTSRPIRVDVAWAFEPAPGRSRWLLSVGAPTPFLD